MLIAGPGSGKTFVITHKVRYMIEELNIAASNILVLTFSRAAAMEMRERFAKLSSDLDSAKKVTWGTFHSVFFNLLKLAYGYRGDQVISDEERYKIVKELIIKSKLGTEDLNNLSSSILAEIAFVKQESIDIEHYYSNSCSAEIFKSLYKGYETIKSSLKKIDFEDMLGLTFELLSKREDIRLACQRRYVYILIDEFQDINRMQYEIVKLMLGPDANISIVGDDDQSIYRFRGAKPEIMLNFHKDFPRLTKIVLDINYRSSKEIVDAASRLIAHNKERFPKKITAFRGLKRPVSFTEFFNPLAEIKMLIKDIRDYTAVYEYNDIAILYRTNLQARLLTKLLMENNIPFIMKDSIPDIFEHWISKDIKSYIKLALSEGNREDVLRIINRPNRFIKREAIRSSDNIFSNLYDYYEDKPFMLNKIKNLAEDLKRIKDLTMSRAVKYIRRVVGYDDFLKEIAKERGIDDQELFDILGELEESAYEYDTFADWVSHMQEYRQELIKKVNESKKENDKELKGVRLMTFHSSKGLEYSVVYIIDANEGYSPYKKAKSKEEVEEERRMFYVAMTRAKDILNICYCKMGFHKRIKPSIFLKEIIK